MINHACIEFLICILYFAFYDSKLIRIHRRQKLEDNRKVKYMTKNYKTHKKLLRQPTVKLSVVSNDDSFERSSTPVYS